MKRWRMSRGVPPSWQSCPECGRKVYGVAQHVIVGPKHLAIETGAKGNQKLIVLHDLGSEVARMWQVGAVPSPKKFLANWHWRWKHEPAVFKSYRHAVAAIREWWKVIHGYHSR